MQVKLRTPRAIDLVFGLLTGLGLAGVLFTSVQFVPPAHPNAMAAASAANGDDRHLPRVSRQMGFSLDTIGIGTGPDVIVAGAPTPSVTKHPKSDLRLGGWAFDISARGAPAALIVAVDEVPAVRFSGTLGRPDVAKALNDKRAEDSGFRYTVPAKFFPTGAHKITIRLVTADGRAYSLAPVKIGITVTADAPETARP